MEQTEITAEIESTIAETMRVDESEISDDTSFGPDGLDADSLAVVEMAEILDMEMGVQIPDDDLRELETVGDVKSYVLEAKHGSN